MGLFGKKKETGGNFKVTKKVGSRVHLDESKRLWAVVSQIRGKRDADNTFSYDEIVDFELLEDGSSVAAGGLGRALVGGALFGGAGAIVGGVTRKSEAKCNSLKIKVTLANTSRPTTYIDMIPSPVKKTSLVYKQAYQDAQDILSTFQIICNQNVKEGVIEKSLTDELLEYKKLLDNDIITQEEFDLKKKEVLGM